MSDEEIVLTHGNKESQCQNVNVTPLPSPLILPLNIIQQNSDGLITPIKADGGDGVVWCDVI